MARRGAFTDNKAGTKNTCIINKAKMSKAQGLRQMLNLSDESGDEQDTIIMHPCLAVERES
jgi:hypothetical protein